jgi:hypothetical protein
MEKKKNFKDKQRQIKCKEHLENFKILNKFVFNHQNSLNNYKKKLTEIDLLKNNITQPHQNYKLKRSMMIGKIYEYFQMFDYSFQTFFSTIYFLDKIFLNSQIIKKEENLCILVCLMISSKINEKKHKNLTASQIIHILEYEFSFDEILKYELHILKFFNYKTLIPTAFDILSFYFVYAIFEEHQLKYLEKEFLDMFKNICLLFLILSIKIFDFVFLKPMIVFSISLYTSRMIFF